MFLFWVCGSTINRAENWASESVGILFSDCHPVNPGDTAYSHTWNTCAKSKNRDCICGTVCNIDISLAVCAKRAKIHKRPYPAACGGRTRHGTGDNHCVAY